MAKDVNIKLPSVWERGGRIHVLKMLTSLRKPCLGTVATLTQPNAFVSEAYPKGTFDICDYMIVVRGDGSIFMSVNQGKTWFVLFDANLAEVLVGTVGWYAGQFGNLPTHWLYCDGRVVSQATYPDLYAIVGTAYGSDAGGNFTLPDLRGRQVVGGNDVESGINGSFSNRSRGDEFGVESHQVTTAEMATHSHLSSTSASTIGAEPLAQTICARTAAADTGSTGGDGTHTTLAPYLCLYPIIKT